ncbi:hypothetical protein V1358_07515 [Pseudoalteromonas sp. YIC-656]|uniref:hypothetical protein n=1 Tax=Pseudoalteromonas pernae TaxID=3118054 RepID=UPI003241C303
MLLVFEDIAKLIGAFVNWGFMMALLLNLANYSEPTNRKSSPIWITTIICISYMSTSSISHSYYLYPTFILADLTTIALIWLVQSKREKIVALHYCTVFLLLNSLLHAAIFIDFDVVGNTEAWWLWSLYSTGINFNDAMMIIVLIINRDFLGLCRAGRYLKAIFQR